MSLRGLPVGVAVLSLRGVSIAHLTKPLNRTTTRATMHRSLLNCPVRVVAG